MYLAIDVGGSKTLLAVFTHDGKVSAEAKIATPKNYKNFLDEVKEAADVLSSKHTFDACCCAIPGLVDRRHGIGITFGNLAWHNVPIKEDLHRLLAHTPVLVENDANLAGLSEARFVHQKYKRVLYLTVSTGIGDGFITNGKIDLDLADSEAGQMVLSYEGKLQKWEDFASGRALYAKTGKLASELHDEAAWKDFVKGLAAGIGELSAILAPEVIVIGGGVGAHFHKFGQFLDEELQKYENEMVRIPPIIKAHRPEEAVIYGCYEFIKQGF